MWIDKDSLKEVIKQYCEDVEVNCPDDMLSEDKGCFRDEIYFNAAHVLYWIMEVLEEES